MAALDIVIVNWNAGQQLRACLGALAASDLGRHTLNRVVVVDNASQDGSADKLDDLGLPVIAVYNKQNLGFAAACNQGAKASYSDYLLFLNPDTRIFKESLSKPLEVMERTDNSRIGIVGIQLVDDTGGISRSCARFPTAGQFFSKMLGLDRFLPRLFKSQLMTDWDHRSNREVDQVIGAFFMVRRVLFESLGGFDERFFVYFEEVDFSYRSRQAGWRSLYLADVQAYHKGGGTSDQIKATRLFYSLRSRILYGYRHFGWLSATGLMLGTLFVEPLTRVVASIVRRSWQETISTVQGYFLLWRDIPRFLRRGDC